MTPKKRVFVFSGRQGSGKTTYAEALRKFIGLEYCKVFKFAEVIYRLHDVCLPILQEYGVVSANIKKEGDLLQILGTQYGRNLKGENVWVDVTRRQVQQYLAAHSKNYVIIDDCRFENEFDAFHPVAHMIRLTAPREVRKARCSAWRENDNHESEVGLDNYEKNMNFDYVINTDKGDPEKALQEVLKLSGYIDV